MDHSRISLFLLCACAFAAERAPVGVLPGDAMARAGVKANETRKASSRDAVRFLRAARYLNGARAVVTHTIDDSTKFVPAAIDVMDRYDVKATIFVSTEREPIADLWPRLRQAITDGHEIGSHSRRHQCKWPDTEPFCTEAYSEYEIAGSRDDILKNTPQPYVWSWCFPCGNCARLDFVQERLAKAGYLVARNYPGEAEDGHIVPDLQTWDVNPYNATYTQVAQKKGGIAKSGRTDVAVLDAKFDQIHESGGIYNLMSHPQWLDYGPDAFYERHLSHVGKRNDIWYVPMGPLYAYHTASARTQALPLKPDGTRGRFVVFNDLDPKIYNGSVTLEFEAPSGSNVFVAGQPVPEHTGLTDRWTVQYFRREGTKLLVTVRPNQVLEFR